MGGLSEPSSSSITVASVASFAMVSVTGMTEEGDARKLWDPRDVSGDGA